MAVEINIRQREWQDFDRAIHGLPERPGLERYIVDPAVDFFTHPLGRAVGIAALVGRLNVRKNMYIYFVMSLLIGVAVGGGVHLWIRMTSTLDAQPVPRVTPFVPPAERPTRTPTSTPTLLIPTLEPNRPPTTSTPYAPLDVTPQSRFERRPI